MRRSLVILTVFVAAQVHAGWQVVPTGAGVVSDVFAYDAGLYAVSTSTAAQAWVVQPDGGASMIAQIAPGNFIGAGLFDGGCLTALVGNQVQFSSAACGSTTTVPLFNTTQATGFFRVAPSGRAWAIGLNATLTQRIWSSTPSPTVACTLVRNANALSAIGELAWSGTTDVGFLTDNTTSLFVSFDGGAPFAVPVGVRYPLGVSAFENVGGGLSVVLVYDDGTLGLIPALDAGAAIVPLNQPAGVWLTKVSFTTQLGDTAGAGFGLAVTDGGALLSPIPDPSRPAATWVARSGAPNVAGAKVHCPDPRFCVTSGAGSSVNVYFNEFAPTVSLSITSSDGGTVVLAADAGDPDGDPIFVSWSSTGTLLLGSSPFGTDVTVTLPAACASVPVTATVSDGWAAHDQSAVIVLGAGAPQVPMVAPPSPVTAPAGSAPVLLTATVDGGCAPTDFLWTGPAVGTADGGVFVWSVPRTLCSSSPAVLVEHVEALAGASISGPATVTLTVLPWGPADAPQFDAGLTQRAGTTQRWSPADLGHACVGTPLFPGTVLSWANLVSTVADAGIAPDTSGLLVRALDECAGGTIDIDAFRSVDGGAWPDPSDAGHLTVTVQVVLAPLDAGTTFSLGTPTVAAAAATASGDFFTNANCPAARGLGATVAVWQDGGLLLPPEAFSPLSAGWEVGPIPGGCSGGSFTVVADLTVDGGATGFTAQAQFTLAGAPVTATGVSPATLPAACGLGVQGSLAVALGAGSCSAVGYRWTETAGLALEPLVLDGGAAWVQSVDRGFEGLGQTLTFEVSLDAGFGNGATVHSNVRVVADPFIAMVGEVHPAPLREEESSQVQVTMHNTTSCAVHGVEARIALADLVPIAGTLRLDGQSLEAVAADGQVVVPGLTLEGDQRRRLQFLARPKLLARPAVTPTAWVGDQQISLAVGTQLTPTPACGCGAAPGTSLLIVAALLRRRRRRA